MKRSWRQNREKNKCSATVGDLTNFAGVHVEASVFEASAVTVTSNTDPSDHRKPFFSFVFLKLY